MSSQVRSHRVVAAVAAAILAAAILAAAPAAVAAAAPSPESLRVAVADLDFANPDDVARFNARVETAARALCRREPQLDFLETGACRRAVRAQCLRQLTETQRRQLLAASDRIRLR